MICIDSCVFMNIERIIFHEIERFFFVVNGKIYQRNSLVANIINPNISKNYKEKMNNKVFKIHG